MNYLNEGFSPRKEFLLNGMELVQRNGYRRTFLSHDSGLYNEFGERVDELDSFDENLNHIKYKYLDIMEVWWRGNLISLREIHQALHKQNIEGRIGVLFSEINKLKYKIEKAGL